MRRDTKNIILTDRTYWCAVTVRCMLCPDMGVFEDQSERTVSVSWGEAAVLDLPSLLSHPQPLVIWQADDGTQLYGRKYALTDRHQLIILSVTDSDQKAYRWVLRCLPRSVFLMKVGWWYIWVERHCWSSDREHITRYLARVLKLYMLHYTTVVVGRYWYLNGRVLDTGSICTCRFWYWYHNYRVTVTANKQLKQLLLGLEINKF